MTKREELRRDLAWSVPGATPFDIMTREEAAALARVHPNSWTNTPSAAPDHYHYAAFGKWGINFYDRRLIQTNGHGVKGGTQAWQAKWSGKRLPWPVKPNTRQIVEKLTGDKAYAKAVVTGVGYPDSLP